jgi:hypothetical protein
MQPRLKSSKKWTAFPPEYSEQIETVFKENFKTQLANGKLVIEGRIYPQEIMLRVGILQKGRLAQANFEVSMDYSSAKKDAVERIHNCIDAAASMMAEYFENDGVVEFPLIWGEFPFQGQKLYLQYNTENSDLEAQANALLGAAGDDALVHEEPELEEGEETEEPSAEPPEEEKSPKMFGGGPKKKKKDMH